MSKTLSLTPSDFVGYGNTLTSWLGAFWTQVYENPELVRNYQEGRGLLAAQMYLNYLEALNLLDRTAAPVFHRERWHPLVLRSDQQDQGQAALMRIGMDPTPTVGPQVEGSFAQGETFQIGGHARYQNVVAYPLAEPVSDILTCITNDITNPTTILVRGTDFLVEEQTIFFLRGSDPLANPEFAANTVADGAGVTHTEVLAWGCDALIDRELVYEHVGYVLGVKTDSTEFYQKMLNALWDTYSEGTPLRYFLGAWGAMFGVPTVLGTTETVEEILTAPDGDIQVVTDQRVYELPGTTTLRDSVVVGATLERGEFLDQAIRLYDSPNPVRLAGTSEYGTQLKTDVPQLLLPPALFRSKLSKGLGVSWEVQDIVNAGQDANGNPKLMFDVTGDPNDIELFWTEFWNRCEDQGISSETCFADYIDDTVVNETGAIYGRVAPLEFFLRYFLWPNTTIVVLDRDMLPDTGVSVAVAARLLQQCMPVYTYLFVVEKKTVGPDDYDLETDADDSQWEAYWAGTARDTATAGLPSTVTLTYAARRPIVRWIPVCPSEEE
jgi:hypothetical protein